MLVKYQLLQMDKNKRKLEVFKVFSVTTLLLVIVYVFYTLVEPHLLRWDAKDTQARIDKFNSVDDVILPEKSEE